MPLYKIMISVKPDVFKRTCKSFLVCNELEKVKVPFWSFVVCKERHLEQAHELTNCTKRS